MNRGRPKLKLEITEAKLLEINTLLHTPGLNSWKRDRLIAVRMAAKGDSSYGEISEALERARSAIERWISLFRKYNGDLKKYLKMRRRRISPLRNLGIANDIESAACNEGVTSKYKAVEWLRRKYGIDRSASTMHYWLAKAPYDLDSDA